MLNITENHLWNGLGDTQPEADPATTTQQPVRPADNIEVTENHLWNGLGDTQPKADPATTIEQPVRPADNIEVSEGSTNHLCMKFPALESLK